MALKGAVLYHCAEPRLAAADDVSRRRAQERIAAFVRLVAAAREDGAAAVLVSGNLLDSGPLDPVLVAEVAEALASARASGLAVITTAEPEEAGRLAGLARGDRLTVLVPEDGRPARSQPTKGLSVFGLGRTGAVGLAARLERIQVPARADAVGIVHLGEEVSPGSAAPLAYLACGGRTAAAGTGPVRDPGPLTRLGLADERDEPGFLKVRIERGRAEVAAAASGDCPRVVVGLDLAAIGEPAALEAALAAQLDALASAGRALVAVKLAGEARFAPEEIDEGNLARLARARLPQAEVEVVLEPTFRTRGGIPFGPRTPRRDIEAAALDRLLAGGSPGQRRITLAILSELRAGRTAGAEAALESWIEGGAAADR